MITPPNSQSYIRQNRRKSRAVKLNFDVPLMLILFIVLIFGLIMMYSASWDFSIISLGEKPTYMFNRQLLFIGIGLIAMLVTSLLDYHHYKRLALPALLVVLAALMILFISGELLHGSVRTIFGGSFMPAEAAKVVIIVYLSVWLYSKRNVLSDVRLGLIPLATILGITSGLILLQPDLSAAATLLLMGGLLFFLAGGDLKQIAFFLILGLLVVWLIVQLNPAGSNRLGSYLEGLSNPLDASYHVQRSLEAFIQGGFFGVGIGNSTTKLTGLPLPATDSIFSVIGEETGFFGATIVILLFVGILWRGIYIATHAPDLLGSLLAAGMSVWIVFEAFFNMSMMINLMPIAGNSLPMFSGGGSNLVVTMAALGLIINVSRMSKIVSDEKNGSDNATDGIRRSYGRRRESGPRRASRNR